MQLKDDIKYWPRWVKYIAWLLCISICLVSAFFTILYGLSFGKKGQEQWLISFFIGVFEDVLVGQPIKVSASFDNHLFSVKTKQIFRNHFYIMIAHTLTNTIGNIRYQLNFDHFCTEQVSNIFSHIELCNSPDYFI